MELKEIKIDWKHARNVLFCVGAGTGIGLIVYSLFLYFHIAIFGWNLGLIFAPLIAGYVETILANRIIGENIGAISAFILFIYTTFYSFILKNPTLGFNIITAGSIIVILQAAFPTLINYILLVVIGGILSSIFKGLRRFVKMFEDAYENRSFLYWNGPPIIEDDIIPPFDEKESNERLNSLDFYFITSTDMPDRKYQITGIYSHNVILDKDSQLINLEPEKLEIETLNKIKEGKDECLIKLVESVKSNGGNGIIDLTLNYNLAGLGGENIQITAVGMGVYIE